MAGITHLKEFQKPALRGLVDASVQDAVPTLGDRFLPNSNIYSNTFAYDIIKTNKYIGAMIGYGSEPPVVDRDAVASKMGEIAKMGLKYIATEEELLALHQARNDAEQAAMIDKLTLKGVDLVNAIQRRIGVIKMEALTKGNFSYNKNGVKVAVDFGVPAEHKVALTSGADWDETDRDVIGDLLNWVDTYTNTNGQAPSVILMSRETNAKLLRNANIVVEAGRPVGSTRVSQAELNAVLDGFGLPPIQIVNDRKVTVKDIYTGNDEVIEFMPVNRVVMLSEGIGEFLLGPTVENDFQPGIALDAYDKQEPIESILRAVAAGFPALEKPSLIFHADVYTA
ncbi:major capsid protein [Heyndrickxia sporothermodurans]|uniref:major capsid protein n=1 Tax=Heyndrickxia sporothermodurans TaxID=46224 RepID=UPI002E1F080D|nr:major capsid protein [Heyndrickxia sporothermodurans]MED3697943.1 major capsid protein [Heyndrickxia sporothermodurans]